MSRKAIHYVKEGRIWTWPSEETCWVLSPMSCSEDGGPLLSLVAHVME